MIIISCVLHEIIIAHSLMFSLVTCWLWDALITARQRSAGGGVRVGVVPIPAPAVGTCVCHSRFTGRLEGPEPELVIGVCGYTACWN